MDVSIDFKQKVSGSNVSFYTPAAMTPDLLANAYITENSSSYYVAEDGVTVYVTES